MYYIIYETINTINNKKKSVDFYRMKKETLQIILIMVIVLLVFGGAFYEIITNLMDFSAMLF